MKIKKLLFKNINSLYGKWEINFDSEDFRKNGLFAITGKTGSGKSTILDAMTLALYGTTPRLSKSTAEAVSRGCHECMSELTFLDTSNREWTATFAYETFKRGEKKGTMNSTAIHRLSCNGRTEADKTTEVRKMVEEITGLDSTRFCRAVLLAQGSFDAFLNAGNENGEILERITGTEIYSRIAAKLKERYDSEKSKLNTIEAQFAGIHIMPEEESAQKKQEAAELAKEITALTEKQKDLNTVLSHIQQFELHQKNLEKCSSEEKILAEEENAFSPLHQRLEEGKKALDADRYYRPFKELQTSKDIAETTLQKSRTLLKEQEELCGKHAQTLEKASAQAEEYQKEYEKLTAVLTAVHTLDNTISLLESNAAAVEEKRRNTVLQTLACREEIRQNTRNLTELEKSHCEGNEYLSAHPQDGGLEVVQKLCTEWLGNAQKLSAELNEVRLQEAALRKTLEEMKKNQLKKQEQIAQEEKKSAALAAELEKIQAEHTELLAGATREHWAALAEKQEKCWHQALLLRSLEEHRRQLKPGEACPLCGSVDHPFAAGNIPEPEKESQELEKIRTRLAGITATGELLLKKSTSLENNRTLLLQLQETLKELTDQIAARQAEADGFCKQKQSTLQNDLSDTCQKIGDALAPFGLSWDKENQLLPAELPVRIKTFAKYKAEQAEYEDRKAELKSALLRLKTALETQFNLSHSFRTELTGIKVKLAYEKGKRQELFGAKDPAGESQKAEAKRKVFESALEKSRQDFTKSAANRDYTGTEIKKQEETIARTAEQLLSARELFLEACHRSGLTEEMFYTSVLEKDEMTALAAKDAELNTRKKQLAENRKTCEDAVNRLKPLLENQPPKEELNQMMTENAARIQDKSQYFGALREQLKQDEDGKLRMAEQHQKLQEQKKVMELWNKMYDLIGSKDKFQRFAQGITLEHLLVLANLELAKLSDRYRLLRSQQEELGIDVADKDQGDEIRSSKTLSGGERFLVSLSLALGLSQMAGEKIRVDSLFLDEGFGTLDSDTLDIALEALNSLRNRGKLVGVISHVAEFSEKIPCSIQVIKQGGGRSILQGPGVKLVTSP